MAFVRRINHIKIPETISGPSKVKVGLPAGKSDGAIINRAIWNHYGTSRGIPARPFLLNSMRKNRSKYLDAMKTSASKILRGETSLSTVLNKLGIFAQGHIQAEITSLKSPPNAPATIKRKGSSNPLIDTGAMRAAITWKLDA